MLTHIESALRKEINRLIDNPQYEVEARIGSIERKDGKSTFDTTVTKENFFLLLKKVENSQIYHNKSDEVFFQSTQDNKRIRFDKTNRVIEVVTKRRVHKEDYRIEGGFDLRISTSKEKSQSVESINPPSKRKSKRKRRVSFVFSYCQLDFTSTNVGNRTIYSVEVEVLVDKVTQASKKEAVSEVIEVLELLLR